MGALCAFAAVAAVAAVAAAASIAAAVIAAAAAGADDVAGADAVVAAVAVARFALSVPEGSGWPTVVAFGLTAAFRFAAEIALAVAAVCFMPIAAMAFTIALPLPFAVAALSPFAPAPPLVFAVEFASLGAPVAWLELKSKLPLVPAEPFAGADVCCAACGGLAGGFAAGFAAPWAGLAGADVLVSSKAANGCESVSWLGVDACIRDGDESETAAGKSDAILGILDTRGPLETT